MIHSAWISVPMNLFEPPTSVTTEIFAFHHSFVSINYLSKNCLTERKALHLTLRTCSFYTSSTMSLYNTRLFVLAYETLLTLHSTTSRTMSTSETRIFVDKPSKDPIKSVRYFLFIVSPFSWFKCFRLIFCRTNSRTRRLAVLHYLILAVTVLLMLASCYLFYAVTADSGQYSLFLSDVAANKTSIDVGRDQFDDLIWRTVLETFFLGLIFGLIQACNHYLAAQWRQRLSDRFRDLLFQSSRSTCNVLYQSTQIDEQITELITNDVQKFTSSFATVLFGSMFFSGSISVILVIIIASALLLKTTGGDFTGIGICFGAFALCILILSPTTQLYNSNLVQQVNDERYEDPSFTHSSSRCSRNGKVVCEIIGNVFRPMPNV